MSISATEWIARSRIDPAIFERWPDYRLVMIASDHVEASSLVEAAGRLHANAHEAARAAGSAEPDAHTVRWHDAYRDFGVKPRVARPSVDALVRRAASENGLPRFNVLVDLYNAVSILHRVPIGGEDLDRYNGPARLIRATGAEPIHTTVDGACRRSRRRRRTGLGRRCRNHLPTMELASDVTYRDPRRYLPSRIHHRCASSSRRRTGGRATRRTAARLAPSYHRHQHPLRSGSPMLIRPADATIDPDGEWCNLVLDHPFGHLIAPGSGRALPVVVPTHIHFDGDLTIRLHLARPNPVWAALSENPHCLFVVTAAVAYIPTSWEAEPGTPPEWGIPTSHYASVQLECTAAVTDEPDRIRRYLADQLATMQPDEPFGDPRDPEFPYAAKLSGIRGVELAITDVRAKFKFDGADPDSIRRQVADGYRRRDAPGDRDALAHLLRRHPPTEEP